MPYPLLPHRQITNVNFLLLGASDCANRSAISRTQIDKWQAKGLITYLGESSDVREFIESCTCVVLPSYYKEGVPRVLLESMSMSKPIITTNVAGCKECIKPPLKQKGALLIGQNGILIPPKSPKALADAIQEILSLSEKNRKIMGFASREYAIERFCITRIIKHYKHTIETLLKNATNTKLAFISNTAFSMLCFRADVLKSLQNLGYEIHILAPMDSHTKALQNLGFCTHHINVDSKGLNPLKDIKTALQIRKILARLNPSVAFNYTIKPVIYGCFMASNLKISNIAVITGLGYVFITGGLKKRILRSIVSAMYKIALKQSKQVWFLNTDDLQEFLDSHIIDRNQAFLLDSEGVDTEFFKPNANPSQALSKITSRINTDLSFLLIARMLWDKGVGEFVQAAKLLRESSNGGGADELTFIIIYHIIYSRIYIYSCPKIHRFYNHNLTKLNNTHKTAQHKILPHIKRVA